MEAGYLAIVTGGARGIGLAITSALLEAGGKVHFLDVLTEEGKNAQKTFDEKYGCGKAVFVQCDVSKKDQLEKAFHEAKSQMGGVNVVCNNAAVTFPAEERTRWEQIVSTNLSAVIHGSMLGLELMGTSYGGNGGVIINTSSVAAIPPLYSWFPVYAATKAGILHYSRCISLISDSANGVRVNCIAPELVETEMAEQTIRDLKSAGIEFGTDAVPMSMSESDARKIFLKPSFIAEETVKLINDKSKNGQLLVITYSKGAYYHCF